MNMMMSFRSTLGVYSGYSLMNSRSSAVPMTTLSSSGTSWTCRPMDRLRAGRPLARIHTSPDSRYTRLSHTVRSMRLHTLTTTYTHEEWIQQTKVIFLMKKMLSFKLCGFSIVKISKQAHIFLYFAGQIHTNIWFISPSSHQLICSLTHTRFPTDKYMTWHPYRITSGSRFVIAMQDSALCAYGWASVDLILLFTFCIAVSIFKPPTLFLLLTLPKKMFCWGVVSTAAHKPLTSFFTWRWDSWPKLDTPTGLLA